MRYLFLGLLVVVLGLQPTFALTPPAATFDAKARVVESTDDLVEGVSYLRVRLIVLEATKREGVGDTPALGPGSTVSAIVRDPGHRAILRSANPSLAVELQLGWFAASVYEVLNVLGQPAGQAPASRPSFALDRKTASLLALLATLVALSALVLIFLRHHGPRQSV